MGSPPPYSPLSTDAQAVANEQNLRVGQMMAEDTPPVQMPPTTPYEVASADTILMARGIQHRDALGLGSLNGGTTIGPTPAYVDAPFGTASFTPQVSRTYYLDTVVSMYVGVVGLVKFQYVLNNTINVADDEASFYFNQTSVHTRIGFIIPVALVAGTTYSIKWQWIGVAGQTLFIDHNDIRTLRIWT